MTGIASLLFTLPLAGVARADDAAVAVDDLTTAWPRAVFARPLTLPRGVTQLGVDLAAETSFDGVAAQVSAQRAVDNTLEVGLAYAAALRPFQAQGLIAGNVGYAVVGGALVGKLEVVARASLGYDRLINELAPIAVGA